VNSLKHQEKHSMKHYASLDVSSSVVSCQLFERSVSAWIFSTVRLMLFFEGQ
jgi:hypothetical protein